MERGICQHVKKAYRGHVDNRMGLFNQFLCNTVYQECFADTCQSVNKEILVVILKIMNKFPAAIQYIEDIFMGGNAEVFVNHIVRIKIGTEK